MVKRGFLGLGEPMEISGIGLYLTIAEYRSRRIKPKKGCRRSGQTKKDLSELLHIAPSTVSRFVATR